MTLENSGFKGSMADSKVTDIMLERSTRIVIHNTLYSILDKHNK